MIEHVPSGEQHAPVGWGQGFGEQEVVAPCQEASHWACVETRHDPSVAQQAPVGWAHGLGSQVALIDQVRPASQAVSSVTSQAPVAAQQAPLGCGQGLGAQDPPGVKTPAEQPEASVIAQDPVAKQQAPSGISQGNRSQVVPLPCQTLGAVHELDGRIEQLAATSQQAPTVGENARLTDAEPQKPLLVLPTWKR